jgi:peptide/nickel transport system permease protein
MGVDVLSLVIYGASNSLIIAVAAAIISSVIGSSIGLVSGYYGGLLSEALMRAVDIFLVMPMILLAIVLAAIVGPGLWNVVFIIAITGWPSTARIVRSQILSIKERTFVERAKTIGCPGRTIVVKYILPRVSSLILTNTILLTSYAILAEAFLSFLGLGSYAITWGRIIFYAFSRGSAYAYWVIVPPGIAIAAAGLVFIMLGIGFEETFNIRVRRVVI